MKLMEKCRSKGDRAELAKSVGVPEDQILEPIKLSDLTRIPGIKKIRSRLYYEGGLDTLDKIAVGELDQNVAVHAAFLYFAAEAERSFR